MTAGAAITDPAATPPATALFLRSERRETVFVVVFCMLAS
jgi:hypothetical protein